MTIGFKFCGSIRVLEVFIKDARALYSPKCGNENKPLDKKAAIIILERLMRNMGKDFNQHKPQDKKLIKARD